MPIALPPIELGSTLRSASVGGGPPLTLTLAVGVPVGALVYVVAGVDPRGGAPAPWTDARGNHFGACGQALAQDATHVYTFASVLTAPLEIGDAIAPAFADGYGTLVGASAVTSGLAGAIQTASAVGTGTQPHVTTAQFIQDNNLVFLVVMEGGGQTDGGYTDDINITPDQVAYPEGDGVHWGWVAPFGRAAMNFNPAFGGPAHWGMIADTLGAIEADLARRIMVDPVAGAAQTPFAPDDPQLPHRLRVQGGALLDGRTGAPWIGMGYCHGAGSTLVPGMSPQDNPLRLDDMAQTKAAGASSARVQLFWQNNSNMPGQFSGYITPDKTLHVVTPPTNPIGSAVPVIDADGEISAGTKITGPLSVAQDGTGSYELNNPPQTVGSAAAPVAMTASPLYPPETKADAYNPTPYTDPNTGYTALVDPTLLGKLDLTVAAAVAEDMWVVVHASGGNEGFWTDGVSIENFCALWRLLVARYGHYDKIALWEPLAEPHPTQDRVSQPICAAMYAQVITAIRAIDTRTPVLIGAASTYNICNVALIWEALSALVAMENIAVTFNWYNLADYVKSSAANPNDPALWTGYPSNPDNPDDPVYPWVQDKKGGQLNAGGIYPGKGQLVCLDAAWMRGMFSVAVNFREAYGAPVWCNQLGGIRTDSIGGLQWMTDVLTMARDYDVGGAIWQWRYGWTSGGQPDNGDLCMVGQIVEGGPWIAKYGTGAPGDTWGDWIGTIQGFMR